MRRLTGKARMAVLYASIAIIVMILISWGYLVGYTYGQEKATLAPDPRGHNIWLGPCSEDPDNQVLTFTFPNKHSTDGCLGRVMIDDTLCLEFRVDLEALLGKEEGE